MASDMATCPPVVRDAISDDARERAYPLPNNTSCEIQRLDGQHAVFAIRTRKLYHAQFPLGQSPPRVVDLGCGTGVWTRRFASTHPDSHVLGIDLHPPTGKATDGGDTPSNCTFAEADMEEDWSLFPAQDGEAPAPFDFVYIRMLMAAVQDWPGLFKRAYQNLRPGGKIEVFEGLMEMNAEDGKSTASTSAAIRWFELAQQYLALHSIKWDLARDIPQQLTDAGFEVTEDLAFKMRLYPDNADHVAHRIWVAAQYAYDMADMISGMTGRMKRDMLDVMSATEWDELEQAARKELLEESGVRGFYTNLYIRVAQKPLDK
ncbi:class I SAM-dependent methyltransferase [Aspergillus ibericus CBS 121593]|uniref:S-adenosyl-L-methionine-dependent methyltransferase n=1 Tax=Aspergillus ibericus CBS 121593 TaxID=1448316 RepID=A0A395H0D2_9EURO|nr:S-adenosyl-L-methionine-dependent methyltransferase [Aspergillus ibericus CBS 121593]RAK99753.1 S-adenosyl-L-methionine-dependent methyltransferase [Aspergillus ibericus CBS 121593]